MINVYFTGRLGADAEVRQTTNGEMVSFSVAVSWTFNKEEKTVWMRVKSSQERFLKLAPHLKKGSMVMISGVETVSLYTDKNGQPQISRDVTPHQFEFIKIGNKQEGVDVTKQETHTPKVEEVSCGVFQQPITMKPSMVGSASDDDDELPF